MTLRWTWLTTWPPRRTSSPLLRLKVSYPIFFSARKKHTILIALLSLGNVSTNCSYTAVIDTLNPNPFWFWDKNTESFLFLATSLDAWKIYRVFNKYCVLKMSRFFWTLRDMPVTDEPSGSAAPAQRTNSERNAAVWDERAHWRDQSLEYILESLKKNNIY